MGASQSHPELLDASPAAVSHKGFLQKESETLKAWNARYCILKDRWLSYWDTEAQAAFGEAPRGRINLERTRVYLGSDIDHATSLVIETPIDAARMAAQRGQSKLYFQAGDMAELRVWLQKLQIASREPWVDGATVNACQVCNDAFDLLNRKHHCRRCGCVACEKCSSRVQAMPDYAYPEPVRVCSTCYGERGPVVPVADRAAVEAARAADSAMKIRAAAEEEAAARKAETMSEAEARKARLRQQLLKKS